MIYTRVGFAVEIVENCGQHQQEEDFGFSVTLVKVKYLHLEGDFLYMFSESLRADEGLNEIMDAVDSADKRKLSSGELQKAMREAS